jgi:hypothetical protein
MMKESKDHDRQQINDVTSFDLLYLNAFPMCETNSRIPDERRPQQGQQGRNKGNKAATRPQQGQQGRNKCSDSEEHTQQQARKLKPKMQQARKPKKQQQHWNILRDHHHHHHHNQAIFYKELKMNSL